jgi:protein involved in polysaccharide export with SLBB domain
MKKALFLLACLTAAAHVSAQSPAPVAPAPMATLQLRPGDALRITVMRHPELSGEFPVNGDGVLVHPLYRELRVTGVALTDTERKVRDILLRFDARPEFVIDPLFQVSVGGEVRMPNVYALRPTTTIAQAVAMAGGASERGRLSQVRLYRNGSEYHVDLTRPERGISADLIQSGDQIVVSRSSSFFRDVLAPAGSIIGALAAVLSIATR